MEELREKAMAFVRELFKDDFGGHGADHTLRVWRNSMIIADEEPGCDRLVVELAALLHDADDHKLFHTENNENTRTFLRENQVPKEQAEAVCRAINAVSFSQNKGKVPDTLEGKSCRTRTGWTPSAPWASPEPSHTAGSTAGRWRTPSGTFTTSFCC